MGSPISQRGRFEPFRVSQGAQSRNFSCANNKYIVCHAMVVCYCGLAAMRGTALRMHFAPEKKTPWGIDPSRHSVKPSMRRSKT